MQKVLLNLANWMLIEFCKEHQIDCSDTRVEKVGRGFKYALINNQSGRTVQSITFNKNSVPTFAGY